MFGCFKGGTQAAIDAKSSGRPTSVKRPTVSANAAVYTPINASLISLFGTRYKLTIAAVNKTAPRQMLIVGLKIANKTFKERI
jgi:hypothetical protein